MPTSRSMLWYAVLSVAALACAGLQLDREARREPALASLVPPPFRNFAQKQLALGAHGLPEKTYDSEQARLLLARSPLPAENLAILGLAASQAGDAGLARRALVASAGRGWREPLAQLFLASAALDGGDIALALERAFAAFAMGNRSRRLAEIFDQLSSSKAGRKAMASAILERGKDGENYAGWAVDEVEADAHGSVLAHVAERLPNARSCRVLGSYSYRYLAAGKPGPAQRLWQGACAALQPGGPAARAFTWRAKKSNDEIFGWETEGAGSTQSANGTLELAWDHKRPGYQVIAQRLLSLRPGNYAVRIEAEAGQEHKARLQLLCVNGQGAVRHASTASLGKQESRVVVPMQGCLVQRLRLLTPRGAGSITDLRIEPEQGK